MKITAEMLHAWFVAQNDCALVTDPDGAGNVMIDGVFNFVSLADNINAVVQQQGDK
jgi:hypothetical protein